MSDQMQKLTPEEGRSLDIVAENVARLRELFPEIVTEDKINFDALKEVLGDYVEDRDEFYNFTWNGKSRARQIAQTPSTGTLRPCKAESKDWDTTGNLYIEGDNLEVLKLLQKSYFGKVKMIYIDPPYNTGKDFIYPDNFKDNIKNYLELTGQVDSDGRKLSTNAETSGRYHTDWLNMMYPRLKLARNLLREDGVIFMSIDESEQKNIRKQFDEIFGEENVEVAIWQKVGDGDAGAGKMKAVDTFRTDHEYLLAAYKKEHPKFNKKMEKPQFVNQYPNLDNDKRGPYKNGNISKTEEKSKENGKNYYTVISPGGRKFSRQWHFSQEKFKALNEDNRIYWGKDGNAVPSIKIFINEPRPLVNSSLITGVGSAASESKKLRKIFNTELILFDNPKPTSLIKYLAEIVTSDNDIILDFFSGSATTAHAVMKLNAKELIESNDKDSELFSSSSEFSEDLKKGKRKFFMVQLPEPCDPKSEAYKVGYKTIAEIGKERIRRAGEKIKQDLKEKPGIEKLDTGFKVFKLDSSNIESWDPEFAAGDEAKLKEQLELGISNIKQDRSDEDLLYEILLKYGIDLSVPIRQVKAGSNTLHDVGMGALILCLDNRIESVIAEEIIQLYRELDPEQPPRIVFRDSGFQDDAAKTNVMEQLSVAGIKEVRSV